MRDSPCSLFPLTVGHHYWIRDVLDSHGVSASRITYIKCRVGLYTLLTHSLGPTDRIKMSSVTVLDGCMTSLAAWGLSVDSSRLASCTEGSVPKVGRCPSAWNIGIEVFGKWTCWCQPGMITTALVELCCSACSDWRPRQPITSQLICRVSAHEHDLCISTVGPCRLVAHKRERCQSDAAGFR